MFQEYLIELSRNGIILAVCSKNNEHDVLEAWNLNPFILLKKEHVSAYRINWMNKADNIKEISKELNIGLDSMVFLDDNPAERELVKQMLPMVEVPDFPDQAYMLPKLAISLLDNFFRTYTLTNEDRQKTEQYRLNSERKKVLETFTDFTEYLKSLEIKLKIEKVNSFNLSRIAQMTQKTNQFNLTTRRYTEPDIQSFIKKGSLIYCLNASDRFGDNGITGLLIIHLDNANNNALIDSFLLSCRILGKGIEKAFIFAVLKKLKSKGFKSVQSFYLPSNKNEQVYNFYDSINFELLNPELASDGPKNYTIDLDLHDFNIEPYYKIEEF
jgi:FkbH-like protein